MQKAGHMHKWTNMLSEQLRSNYRPYTHETTSHKQTYETLGTNHLTHTEPQTYATKTNQDFVKQTKHQFKQYLPTAITKSESCNDLYLRQAYCMQNKRKSLRKNQIIDTFDHIQQFSFIQHKHHPLSKCCSSQVSTKKIIQNTTKPQYNNVRTVLVHTPVIMQPVHTIYRPIQTYTIFHPVPHLRIIPTAPLPRQNMQTLDQAHRNVASLAPIQKMTIQKEASPKIKISNQKHELINEEQYLLSPYENLNTSSRYQNEATSQTPKVIITQPYHQQDDDEMNIPQQDVANKIIVRSAIQTASLTSPKNNIKENEQQQSKLHPLQSDLNQSLQIFNGGNSVLVSS